MASSESLNAKQGQNLTEELRVTADQGFVKAWFADRKQTFTSIELPVKLVGAGFELESSDWDRLLERTPGGLAEATQLILLIQIRYLWWKTAVKISSTYRQGYRASCPAIELAAHYIYHKSNGQLKCWEIYGYLGGVGGTALLQVVLNIIQRLIIYPNALHFTRYCIEVEAERGHAEVLDFLVNRFLSLSNEEKERVLIAAFNHKYIMRNLIDDLGCNPWATESEIWPIYYAVCRNNLEAVDELLGCRKEKGNLGTALPHVARHAGEKVQVEMMGRLVEWMKEHVNSAGLEQFLSTCLDALIRKFAADNLSRLGEREKALRCLVGEGALRFVDESQTVAYLGITGRKNMRFLDILSLDILSENGADINAIDFNSFTALFGLLGTQWAAARRLIEAGADPRLVKPHILLHSLIPSSPDEYGSRLLSAIYMIRNCPQCLQFTGYGGLKPVAVIFDLNDPILLRETLQTRIEFPPKLLTDHEGKAFDERMSRLVRNSELLNVLLEFGAPPDIGTPSLIERAIAGKHEDTVAVLVARGARLPNKQEEIMERMEVEEDPLAELCRISGE
ncbi:hypothetical protein HK097_000727 [Rhizophlyctis rosea]|uniref:Uncharacterized protein n=1 Tax=Rhizophlyctis rosea TaxID=64517 RepID=A0AAD5S7R5_9FUNG|nr:hypothetical protein HK097_000727 [Rhizophlyctis rosea]